MARNAARTVLGLALAALGALYLGCTGSDQLVTQPGNLSLEIQFSPVGSGRYETGSFQVKQVSFRPMDPEADAALGDTSLAFLTSPISVTLQSNVTVSVGSVLMTEGTYRIDTVLLSNLTLTDQDATATGVCIDDYLADRDRYQGKLPPSIPNEVQNQVNESQITITGFSPDETFTVARGGESKLRMVIDGPGLTQAYESAFNCRASGSCSSGASTIAAPCIFQFTPLASEQVVSFVRFE
jgi:hypothetical protein